MQEEQFIMMVERLMVSTIFLRTIVDGFKQCRYRISSNIVAGASISKLIFLDQTIMRPGFYMRPGFKLRPGF